MSDERLVAALRDGDESAFAALVHRYGSLMRRVALGYVRTPAVADEVVQETWLAVFEGIDRFEGRCALKTWVMRILCNRAKTRGVREARFVPVSSIETESEPAADRSTMPDVQLVSKETLALLRDAIAALPERQQEVIVLRDVEGWSAQAVCTRLGINEGNQRVLLHRARTKVCAALRDYTAVRPPSTVQMAPVT